MGPPVGIYFLCVGCRSEWMGKRVQCLRRENGSVTQKKPARAELGACRMTKNTASMLYAKS